MKNEQGRSMSEILAVLAIVGLLSVGGLIGYSQMLQKKDVDDVLDVLQQKIVEIHSAQANKKLTDPDKMNAFLEDFTTTVGDYQLSFHATGEMDGSFVSQVTHKDGTRIKGAFCRQLITKMSEQQFVEDVDFSLEDEEQEDGSIEDINVPLNGKMINLNDVCGS